MYILGQKKVHTDGITGLLEAQLVRASLRHLALRRCLARGVRLVQATGDAHAAHQGSGGTQTWNVSRALHARKYVPYGAIKADFIGAATNIV